MRLRVADLDNNGAIDLILMPVTRDRVERRRGRADLARQRKGRVRRRSTDPAGPARVFDAADIDGDGQARSRRPCRGRASECGPSIAARRNYHWQIDPAARSAGVRRSAHQSVRRRRRGRDSRRAAACRSSRSPARRFISASASRPRPTSCGSCGRTASCSAEFDAEGRPGGRRRAAPEGIVSVPVRVRTASGWRS